jgi:hypothetical protein
MNMLRALLVAALMLAVPCVVVAEVIPISAVNEDDENGQPVLWTEVVTVRGVVTIGTGVLAPNTDIYIEDGTGGLNIIQPVMASPTVAAGDSVLVTGRVSLENGNRTSIRVDTSITPGARIVILNSGNPLPAAVELTVRQVALGEEWEGTYAVVRDVELTGTWQSSECAIDQATYIADADTTCRMWFDADTDLCGSPEPLDRFDVYGVVIPRPRIVSSWRGHGMLPPSRSDVRSHGSGAGLAGVEPSSVFTSEPVRLAFDVRGEADVLTDLTIDIPDGWAFSGNEADVRLDGAGFAEAAVDGFATTPIVVVIEGCTLATGSPGTVTLAGLTTPSAAATSEFVIGTAVAGGDPMAIGRSPVVTVYATAAPGAVLINEIVPTGTSFSIEYHNPDHVDMTGWVLAMIDGESDCGIAGYSEITPEARTSGGYLVASTDRWQAVRAGWVPPSEPGRDERGRSLRADAYTAFLLYTDPTFTYLVDAVDFRDPVFFREEPCPDHPGLGGPNEPWAPAPIPAGYSLGRDAASTDTDNSSADFHLSSTPTLGSVNVPYDTAPPSVSYAASAGSWYAIVKFSEPVNRGDAENVSNFDAGDALELRRTWLSRDERTVLVSTDTQTPGAPYTIAVNGIRDLAGNLMAQTAVPFSGHYELNTPISEIQQYDENGYSPLAGHAASTIGFTTVPPGVFQPDRTNMYIQDIDGWGINVYMGSVLTDPPIEGDLVGASGSVIDYVSSTAGAGATTEIDADNITVIARGFDLVHPTVRPTGEVGREEY